MPATPHKLPVPPYKAVDFADNNNGPGGWLRLFVEQAGGQAAVSQVQIRTSNSGKPWISMDNVYGGDWEIGQTPDYPLGCLHYRSGRPDGAFTPPPPTTHH